MRTLRVERAKESKRTTFKTQVNDLCDDLLLNIMTFLSIKGRITLERVCHRWRHLSLQSWSTLKSVHFRNMFKRFGGVTDKMLHSLLQRCGSNLVSLDLSASPRLLTDYALDIIGHFCPNLTYVDLSGVAVTNKSLKNLSTECRKLKVIKLPICIHVGEKGLWWVLHHCKELELIDMEFNSNITGKCFHMAGPKIRTLHLTGCISLSDTAISKLAQLCPLMEELHLRSSIRLTDSAIEILGTSFPNMTVLEATGSYPETSLESWSALGHSANLVELDLSQNIAVGDAALAAISVGCLQLRKLDISSCHQGVTDAGIQTLAKLPVLEYLSISYLHMIHDESLELIAINGRLRQLTAQACGGLTDQSFTSVAEHCSQLFFLDISGNIQMTNTILFAFIRAVWGSIRRIVLYAGGTSVVPESVSAQSCVEVNLMDLSINHLPADRELLLPEPYEEDVEEDWDVDVEDRPDPAGNFKPAGEEVGECLWEEDERGQFDDLCHNFLDNDDPLNEELWDLG